MGGCAVLRSDLGGHVRCRIAELHQDESGQGALLVADSCRSFDRSCAGFHSSGFQQPADHAHSEYLVAEFLDWGRRGGGSCRYADCTVVENCWLTFVMLHYNYTVFKLLL